MSCPAPNDFLAAKRIARYLIHVPRPVILHRWQDTPSHLAAYADSSWAGCLETRKSTSGAVFMHGGGIIKHYPRTLSTIALSFAEADLYATVAAASEALGMAAVCEEYRDHIIPYISVDAFAVIGIARRKGLGQFCHLDIQSLWIQDAIRERRVRL